MSDEHQDFVHDYLKESYEFELGRVDTIRERISFISGFLLIFGAGIGSLLWNYTITFGEHSKRDYLFLLFLALSTCGFIGAVFLTAICLLRGFLYSVKQSPNTFLAHTIEWENYNASTDVTSKENIEAQLKMQLRELYAAAATSNFDLNNERLDMLLNSMRVAFVGALFLIVPAACLIQTKYGDAKPALPYKVEIISPVKIK